MIINLKKLNEEAIIPTKGSEYSAGYDLYACIDNSVVIKSGETVKIPTGIAIEIPYGYVGLIYSRSGISTKRGLSPANKVGVIDADYRGEILIFIHNHSKCDAIVEKNERIAQIIITPFLDVEFNEVDILSETSRGKNGFGSTGYK